VKLAKLKVKSELLGLAFTIVSRVEKGFGHIACSIT
jgi:hypothetical protein